MVGRSAVTVAPSSTTRRTSAATSSVPMSRWARTAPARARRAACTSSRSGELSGGSSRGTRVAGRCARTSRSRPARTAHSASWRVGRRVQGELGDPAAVPARPAHRVRRDRPGVSSTRQNGSPPGECQHLPPAFPGPRGGAEGDQPGGLGVDVRAWSGPGAPAAGRRGVARAGSAIRSPGSSERNSGCSGHGAPISAPLTAAQNRAAGSASSAGTSRKACSQGWGRVTTGGRARRTPARRPAGSAGTTTTAG